MIALQPGLVLAMYPNMSGLCYAVFEGKSSAIDWGIKTAGKAKEKGLERHAQWLIKVFSPATIILPKRGAVAPRSDRLQLIVSNIEKLANECGIRVHSYTRSDIQQHFIRHKVKSKDGIARVIARLLPEFVQHLPPWRKKWMSEDYRMGLFDAAALAMVYFETHRGQ
jgi:hypothetical protein